MSTMKLTKKINGKLFILCFVLFFVAEVLFPEKAFSVTIKQEEDMGHEFMRVVSRYYKFIKDPVIINYLNKIGHRIVAVLPDQPFAYRFYVIKEDTYNAFASPAGNIFINSGLFEAMENEEELAGILAHEIAHVKCRHISQKIERASKIGLLTLAGIAAGIFLGAGGSGAAASALTIGSMAAGQSLALAYSREDEMQADQIGLKYLTEAGYSGKGMIPMLKKIRGKQWFAPGQIPTYLTTHPAVDDRIAYIDTWLENYKNTPAAGHTLKISLYDFASVHTRLLAIYGDENSVLKQFKARLLRNPLDPLAHYRYGLILERTGSRKDAAGHLKIALEKKAFDPQLLKDLGRIYFFDGRYNEAISTLKSAISITPFDPEALFFLGRSRMQLGKLEEAAATFEELIAKNGYYKQTLYFLGETFGKMGKMGDAHYYLGIYYKDNREFGNALFHLKKALKLLNDPDKIRQTKQILAKLEAKQTGNRKP